MKVDCIAEKCNKDYKSYIKRANTNLAGESYSHFSRKIINLEKKCKINDAEKLAIYALKKSKKEKNYKFISEFYKELGVISRIKGNLEKANTLISRSLKIARTNNFLTEEANAYGNLGILAFINGNYLKAIKYHRKAIKLHSEKKDKIRIIPNLSFIGVNYMFLKKYKVSERILTDALKLSKKENYQEGIADSLYNLSILLIYLKKYKKAEILFNRAIKLFEKIKNIFKKRQTIKLKSYLSSIKNGNAKAIVLSNNKCN